MYRHIYLTTVIPAVPRRAARSLRIWAISSSSLSLIVVDLLSVEGCVIKLKYVLHANTLSARGNGARDR